MVDDSVVQKAILENTNAIKAKQDILAAVEKRIHELEEEKKLIRTCSVHFAAFLKDSAIVPYNDVFEAHAKKIIEEERRIVAQGGKSETLQGLENSMKIYREERATIEAAMASASSGEASTSNAAEIAERLQRLFTLPHTGKDLKALFDHTRSGERTNARTRTIQMPSRWNENRSASSSLYQRIFGAAKQATVILATR